MSDAPRFARVFHWLIAAAVALTALLVLADTGWGIAMFVSWPVLLMIAGLVANAVAIRHRRLGPVPYIGSLLITAAIAMVGIGISTYDLIDSRDYWPAVGIVLIIGGACTYASLLSLPTLTGRYVAARRAGMIAVAVLACLLIAQIRGATIDLAPFVATGLVAAASGLAVMVGSGSQAPSATRPVDERASETPGYFTNLVESSGD